LLFSATETLVMISGILGIVLVLLSTYQGIRSFGANFIVLVQAFASIFGIIMAMGFGFAFLRMVEATIDARNFLADIYSNNKNK